MKRSRNFFQIRRKLDNGDVFWNIVFIQPLGENRNSFKNQEFDETPDIQAYFTNTKLTTKILDNIEKETEYYILDLVGFYDNIPKKRLKSARMKDSLYNLQKAIDKFRKPFLPTIENIDSSDNLQGKWLNINIPSNIIDIYTRLAAYLV